MASGVAHMDRPLFGKMISASMPSRSWSRSRCFGSAPACWRSWSSTSRLLKRMRSGRCPSDTRHCTPSLSVMTRGSRSRYLASIRSAQRFDGSLAWQSADTMKYLLGSPGRAVRGQPMCPGESSRHRLGSLISTSLIPLSLSDGLPVHESERNFGVVVRLEHGFDGRADLHELARVAEEIAQHADVAGVRQLHEHDDVRAMLLERGMHGVPGAFPAKDRAAAFDPLPGHVEG